MESDWDVIAQELEACPELKDAIAELTEEFARNGQNVRFMQLLEGVAPLTDGKTRQESG